jgi:hypothetical protein
VIRSVGTNGYGPKMLPLQKMVVKLQRQGNAYATVLDEVPRHFLPQCE